MDGILAVLRVDPHAATAAAVEWWATLLEEGQPATLIGTSLLTFTPEGLVATARLGADAFRIDGKMRRIPDHFHAHARDPAWPGFAWG